MTKCRPFSFGLLSETPRAFATQLETLVARFEESFASTEMGMSPGSAARLLVEKQRITKLIHKMALAAGDSVDARAEDSLSTSALMTGLQAETDGDGTAAWKCNTLIRLRKFLKKKYMQKKSE